MDLATDAPSQLCPDEERAAKRRRTSVTPTHPPREVGLMRNLPGDKFPSFVGSASGIHFIRSVYGSIRQSHPPASGQAQTPEKDIVPGEDDYLSSEVPGSTKRLWKDDEISAVHIPHLKFQDLVEWSASYFANWHPAYPFLHAPAILTFFRKLERNELPPINTHNGFEMVIIKSIMSISLADRRQSPLATGPEFPSILVFETYDDAIGSLQMALSRPASIRSLQAALSVQLFLVSMLRLNAASRPGGLILRMALQLGLHRCPNRFPSFSTLDRELRQRLFWSIYCIDRLICQSMGLPLSLRDDDIDVCYPSEERHQAPCAPSDSRLRCVEYLARHSQIRGQIMELRNKSIEHSQKETDQSIAITARLTRWWNDVEEFIDSEPQVLSLYHRTVLTVLYHESIISLNRPILALRSTGPLSDAALQHCLYSSKSIITTLHEAISQAHNAERDKTTVLSWPSFTWGVWMSTFILFHAANSEHISHGMVARLTERSSRILQHVSRRGNIWPDACASAIQHLHTHLLRETPGEGDPAETRVTNRTGQSTPSAPSVASSLDQGTGVTAEVRHQHANPSQSADHITLATPNAWNGTGFRDNWTIDTNHGGDPGAGLDSSWTNSGLPQPIDFGQSNQDIDQLLSLPADGGVDPFASFDIPFWLGQDEYAGLVNEWS